MKFPRQANGSRLLAFRPRVRGPQGRPIIASTPHEPTIASSINSISGAILLFLKIIWQEPQAIHEGHEKAIQLSEDLFQARRTLRMTYYRR